VFPLRYGLTTFSPFRANAIIELWTLPFALLLLWKHFGDPTSNGQDQDFIPPVVKLRMRMGAKPRVTVLSSVYTYTSELSFPNL
jgi:hypothetical protein